MGSYQKMQISFLTKEGETLLKKKLTALPIREEILIARSITFFNDPEPCMIHRSAVMKRIYCELGELLDKAEVENNGVVLWAALPAHLQEALAVKGDVYKLVIT